jgi:succinate dehydrogenase/fumarate reductase flavoprotein subunit
VVDEINALREMKRSQKPAIVTNDLQRVTWETMLVHINENLLNRALREIGDIRENRLADLNVETTQDTIDALELRNLLLVGEILARAIQMRKETRGDHYREDHPERDDTNWLRVIKVRHKDGEMQFQTEVIDPDWSERPGDMFGMRWG